MAINAVEYGLSWEDLHHMKYTHLVQLLWEWEDARGSESVETVDAKPSDVNMLKTL